MTDSRTLLEEFAANGSEAAFRELVNRYVNLVHSTALRLLNGNHALAEDVTQSVFLELARHAGRLSHEVMLGGWLHRRTCHTALSLQRSERRRVNRERIAMELQTLQEDTEANLARIAPILDQAINQLATPDRAAILLRFFEQRDFQSVGEALGTKEDAARMRVTRALEKLRQLLGQKGISLSATALGLALTSGTISAAPTGLAASVASTTLTTVAAGSGVSLTLINWLLMPKLKTAILGAVILVAVGTPVVLHHQSAARLQEQSQLAQLQSDRARQLAEENDRLSNSLHQASVNKANTVEKESELLRLRGEVGRLRKLATEATQSPPPLAPVRAASGTTDQEVLDEQAKAKMGYARNWVTAFFQYADNHEEQLPKDLQSAATFLPEKAREETLQASNQFEILYQGTLYGISNPSTALVLRETQPFPGPGGGWLRTYGFADGHTEIHRADDGNFQPWEVQHQPVQGAKSGALR